MIADLGVTLTTSIGALAAFITSLTTLVVAMRSSKQVREVHILVNSRMTEVVARVDQLTTALEDEGKDVPPDPADRSIHEQSH